MTIEELKELPKGTELLWYRTDNTRFRPQPRYYCRTRLVRVTDKRAFVEFGLKVVAADPKWLSKKAEQ